MKTTDEIMELVERHVKRRIAQCLGTPHQDQGVDTARAVREAIDGTKHEYRDYIAVNLPADRPTDFGTVLSLTGKSLGLDMTTLEEIILHAQAEAKLRYIRADAMLAARGEA